MWALERGRVHLMLRSIVRTWIWKSKIPERKKNWQMPQTNINKEYLLSLWCNRAAFDKTVVDAMRSADNNLLMLVMVKKASSNIFTMIKHVLSCVLALNLGSLQVNITSYCFQSIVFVHFCRVYHIQHIRVAFHKSPQRNINIKLTNFCK